MKLHQNSVLVLNRNWQAVNTITPADALSRLVVGTAKGLDVCVTGGMTAVDWSVWHTLPIRNHDEAVNTPTQSVRVPTVVILNEYARVPLKTIKFGFKGLWVRDRGRCQYTGRELTFAEANIDHVYPQSRGGPTTWENCVLSSVQVNQRKADRTPQEAGLRLISQPRRPRAMPVCCLIQNTHGIDDWNHFLPK